MKDLIYKILDIFLKLLVIIIPVKKNKILFLSKVSTGSNTTIVAARIKEERPELTIVEMDRGYKFEGIRTWLKEKIRLYYHALTSKIIVTTHGPLIKTHKNININLWHAFPTKKTGLMLDDISVRRIQNSTDYFLSYSTFSSVLLNSRNGIKGSKYIELGSPRNDYLFENNRHKFNYLDKYRGSKIVYYLPTYREQEHEIKFPSKYLRFPLFNFEKFNNFLRDNGINFIVKFHPKEEHKMLNSIDFAKYSNIILLKEEYLDEGFTDFYEILPHSDILITDYLSIYADYLLLDKPMIFTPTDIEEYNQDRGLLLEPYEFWRPGPICMRQENLQEELLKCLNDNNYYEKEREIIKMIFHKYDDGKSTERVIDFISSKLSF